MTPATMTKETAAEAMRPMPEPITLDSTAAVARERMREENLSFLPVVSPENDKLLGVVLRGTVERACEANGHDPETCPLAQHLKADIDFCFAEEQVEEVRSTLDEPVPDGGLAARKARVRKSLPVIVVDEQKVPLGYLMR
jgi:CBS domain-containing protein